MAAIARSNNRKRMTYVRDIPLTNRLKLCKILDVPGPGQNWKQLAALLGFSADDCYSFEKAFYTPGGSPTDEMLKVWDFGNHTVTELYNNLYKMSHARGMMLLKEFVDADHREKIKKVQGQQPEENSDEATLSSPLNPQPHAYRQHQGAVEPAAKLHDGTHSANLYREVSHQKHVNQDPSSTRIPMHGGVRPSGNPNHIPPPPSSFRNGEAEASMSSQSSWNGSPSPGAQYDSAGKAPVQRPQQFKDGFQYNLDGGTQKEINSPLIRPSFNTDGRLSDDNNVESKLSSTSNTMVRPQSSRQEKEKLAQLTVLSAVMTVKYEDIRRATNNFSDSYKLGAGSFGTVYFMIFEDTKFAIKRLLQDADPNSTMNQSRFSSTVKEITSLATYRHPNVVTLCFNCTDGPEPCLGYEYMQNGSLEDNLQLRGTHKQPLDWEMRNRIMLGAARGLNYLHNAQEQPLIHGDIKSANILLDETLKPKIGDFGLARYGPDKGKSYTILKTSKAYGTMPYLPKDFLSSFKLSVKVDVYSFGIVLMEVLTGEKAADEKREPKTKWLYHIVLEVVDSLKNEENFEQKIISKLCDSRCQDWPWDLAWQLLELALQCTNKFPQRRPEMKEVVQSLHKINDRIQQRDLMRKRSLPTQNTEPLPPGREPQESHYEGSSGELHEQNGNFKVQDPQVTSVTPEQKAQDLSAIDKKMREMGLGPVTTTPTGVERSLTRDPSYMTNEPTQYPGGYQQFYQHPHMPQDLRSVSQDPTMPGYRPMAGNPQQSFPTGTSSTVPSSFMNRPTPPSTATPPSTNPPVSNFQDDRRYGLPQGQSDYRPMAFQRQDGYRQYTQGGPSEQYTRGESSGPYMHGDPNWSLTHDYANPSYIRGDPSAPFTRGNPNVPYTHGDQNARYTRDDPNAAYNHGDLNAPYTHPNAPHTQGNPNVPYTHGDPNARYMHGEPNRPYTRNESNGPYTGGEPTYKSPYPHPQYDPYQQQHPNYYPTGGRYTPGHQFEQYQYNTQPHYDHMQSINPALFTAAPPTPTPNQCNNIQGQLARLDASQLPGKYTHRGQDSSRPTSRNTPSPSTTPADVNHESARNSDENVKRNAPTLEQQQSYVQFPDSLGDHRAPVQQTCNIPSPTATASVPTMTSKDPCAAVNEAKPNSDSDPPVRQSPLPTEHTDIITPLKQLHLDGVTSTQSTDTQELERSTSVTSVSSWDGERKKPVPSQHTDKLTRELPCDNFESHATHSALGGDQSQYHSAPPGVGRQIEDTSTLSIGSRVPMQMTEPLVDPHQGRK